MADKSKPEKPDISEGLKTLKTPPVPEPTEELEPEKKPDDPRRGSMQRKTCPKCFDSPVMNAAPVIAIIPAMIDERFGNVKKISEMGGLPVQAYECPQCHFVELYRAE